MMAELVQGQASVSQPGLKSDGFADAFQRARQVTTPVWLPAHPTESEPGVLDEAGTLLFQL